ncbi:GTP cyclohydrolase II [Fodinicurvata sediminis]|uniref:GTP cyclohydrolase II n=1 Tax=Fodinicurvata sediminis TaxID=1121832 RepID=UPI0004249885|nr:GTP cyclohydrolase II [Fodinicurvata sediminis]
MNEFPVNSPLSGPDALDPDSRIAVERAVSELRRACLVFLGSDRSAKEQSHLVLSAENADHEAMTALRQNGQEQDVCLLLSAPRAEALGLVSEADAPLALDCTGLALEDIVQLANPADGSKDSAPHDREDLAARIRPFPQASAEAALELTKLARLLPAALIRPVGQKPEGMLSVSPSQIRHYRGTAALMMKQVASAQVPLLGAENTRIVAFRPADGGREHLAIVVGSPSDEYPVLTRLHSECFTGDLLRSLRCDCGDQLRGAIEAMTAEGAGILLYLAQEGRGIGLVNKLRAYRLQDQGADTLEANEALGFDADERVYEPAAEMLKHLGFTRIRLLTNNPDKVSDLARHGITVEDRVTHSFPSNGHNEAYLDTKARRFGHMFEI